MQALFLLSSTLISRALPIVRSISPVYSLLLLFFSVQLHAQNRHTVDGVILRKSDGKPVSNCTILSKRTGEKPVYYIPDEKGRFGIKNVSDSIELVITGIGYAVYHSRIFADKDVFLTIYLEEITKELKEVEVAGGNRNKDEKQPGIEMVEAGEARAIPVISGEVDIIKNLQLKPGIRPGTEGSSSLTVRGGSPDQNLMLLDETVVYNPNHLFGFLSIFNNDVVKDATVYKGIFPARYGGRLSSVVEVKTLEGNPDSLRITGGIGLISSRIVAEGPLSRKISGVIGIRRSYFDAFTKVYNTYKKNDPEFEPYPEYYLYDLNGKLSLRLNARNLVSASAYTGADNYKVIKGFRDINFYWTNKAYSLKWLHTINSRLLLNTSLHYSGFRNNISTNDPSLQLELNTTISDYSLKTNLDYHISDRHLLRAGLFGTANIYRIAKLSNKASVNGPELLAGEDLKTYLYGLHLADEMQYGKLRINAGMRYSSFRHGSSLFHSLEPRFLLQFQLKKDLQLNAGYAKNYQFLHLISNPGGSLPTDIWYPSGYGVDPQTADQISTGIIKLYKNKYTFRSELYYKWLGNQIEFRDGAQLIVNKNYRDEFVFGSGNTYGLEIAMEKKTGRLNGWISYTLSQNWRTFKEINYGEPYHPNFDRRHDLNIVTGYTVTERLKVNVTWVYMTGNYVSIPLARYLFLDVGSVSNPQSVPLYTERNGYRMNNYHRLDLSATWKLKPRKGEAELVFSIYNAYNRQNPYFIYFEDVRDSYNNILYFKARQVSLFSLIPGLSYNFRF
jgi:hypothetical protein